MTHSLQDALYGSPSPLLAGAPDDALQMSPLVPGASSFESLPDASLGFATLAAPPGSIERRYVLAQALRCLAPGAPLVALAPKDRGGARLRAELERFGCTVAEDYKARQRICRTLRPDTAEGLGEAIEDGGLHLIEATGLWSQPGVFSFDRIDPGSALLADAIPQLSGAGADLGAGLGVLSRAALRSPAIRSLALVEIDRRALDAARRNVRDERASFHWSDARSIPLADLDFALANPPFHAEGTEDRSLGQSFITAAARMLRRGGALWLVANRHMPYEAVLGTSFRSFETRLDRGGYKIIEARR